jgi:hypothetical protein
MAEPWYITREEVKNAIDFSQTAYSDTLVDKQCAAASRAIDGRLHRVFYPTLSTRYFDWPNFDYAYPWRIWFNQYELAAIPTSVTSGGTAIPVSAINFEPVNSGPPYTYMEIQRNTSYGFGVGPTPQHDVAVTGTFGFNLNTIPAGTVPSGGLTSSATSVNLGVPGYRGVGSILLIDSEYMLVTGRSSVSTGTTIQGNLTAAQNNTSVPVTDITQYTIGETLLIDAERMRVLDAAGSNLIVVRGTDGTALATHSSGATIYAQRQLTVTRGALGSTQAAHTQNTAITEHDPPSLIRDLALVEAVAKLLRIPAGFPVPISRRTQTSVSDTLPGSVPSDLADMWDAAVTQYGRKARKRVI